MNQSIDIYHQQQPTIIQDNEKLKDTILNFFLLRLKKILLDNERQHFKEPLSHEWVEAITSKFSYWQNLYLLKERVTALLQYDSNSFELLMTSFKRIDSILQQFTTHELPQESLLNQTAEKELWQQVIKTKNSITEHIDKGQYNLALQLLQSWCVPIDQFFEQIMVNDSDPQVKLNRQKLLCCIRHIFFKNR